MAILDRICKECSVAFQGGPRAYYCPSCREIRRKAQSAVSKARERRGLTRKLGSLDTCDKCRNDYIVKGGLQRFCETCQPIHAAEHDRITSLEFYRANTDKINPVRNERRRVGNRNCDWCGSEYVATTAALTCSDECKRLLKNKKWNDIYGPRYRETKKAPDQ